MPDLYGRGYTEAPKETVTTNDYITQLALLLQYVGWTSSYVIGLSMGGGVAAGFTATFPHLVKGKLVLLASAGLLDVRKFRSRRHPVETNSTSTQFPIDEQGEVRHSLSTYS